MATVVKRAIRATPHRTSSAAWRLMTELITPDASSTARRELTKVDAVLGQLIASESFVDEPIVVHGGGTRVRLYCLYNDAAVEGDDADERALTSCPTEGDDWAMSVPCSEDDFVWVTKELAKHGRRVTARRAGEDVAEEAGEEAATQSASINIEDFLKS